MTFARLRREYDDELIGEAIYARVASLARDYLRRRDPRVYARGSHDYRDGLEDVLNDFVMDVLIRERQIDYIMSTAVDLNDFDALMNRHLRRYIARTRVRTVIDNLIGRSIAILRHPPFDAEGRGSDERFWLSESNANHAPPTQNEIRMAASLAQPVPKVIGQGEERAPRIYDKDGLTAALVILVNTVTGFVTKGDLQKFFEHLLTPWAVSLLELPEGFEATSRELTPSEEVIAEETSQRIIGNMATDDRVIYQYKFANVPDRVVADAIGLSRQATAPRKKALFENISAELIGLETHVQEGVLVRLNSLIATTGLDIS